MQASFQSEGAFEQHMQSAVHRKAVEKRQAEIAKMQRMQQ
jgi:quinol monooxygenase YgiN